MADIFINAVTCVTERIVSPFVGNLQNSSEHVGIKFGAFDFWRREDGRVVSSRKSASVSHL